jgi:hypothetical protein
MLAQFSGSNTKLRKQPCSVIPEYGTLYRHHCYHLKYNLIELTLAATEARNIWWYLLIAISECNISSDVTGGGGGELVKRNGMKLELGLCLLLAYPINRHLAWQIRLWSSLTWFLRSGQTDTWHGRLGSETHSPDFWGQDIHKLDFVTPPK